jgi:hypothetical protein
MNTPADKARNFRRQQIKPARRRAGPSRATQTRKLLEQSAKEAYLGMMGCVADVADVAFVWLTW